MPHHLQQTCAQTRNAVVLAAIHRDAVSRCAVCKRSESANDPNGWDRDYFRAQEPWLKRKRSNAFADLKRLAVLAPRVEGMPNAERWKGFNSILRQVSGCINEIEHADAALGSIAASATKTTSNLGRVA